MAFALVFGLCPIALLAPRVLEDLIFTGAEQRGIEEGAGYNVHGGSATDAGSYKALVMLKDSANYVWADGSQGVRIIPWAIGKCVFKNAGTATVIVQGIGNYGGSASTVFTIAKENQAFSASSKTVSVKFKKLEKKAQSVAAGKVIAISGVCGAVSFKKVSGSKNVAVAANGKVKIKKGLKKGTYKVRVRVSAGSNANYLADAKAVTIRVKVK